MGSNSTVLTSQFLANTVCVNAALWHKTDLKCIEILEAGDCILSVTHCVYCAEKKSNTWHKRLNQPGFLRRIFSNQAPIQHTMLLLTLLKFLMTYFSYCNRGSWGGFLCGFLFFSKFLVLFMVLNKVLNVVNHKILVNWFLLKGM